MADEAPEKENDEIGPTFFKINKWEIFRILSILILACFASVYMFTNKAIWARLILIDTGQIGDTVGGLTAPIINIGAAILVYISFREQNKANKLQYRAIKKEWEKSAQQEELRHIESLFDQLQFLVNNTTIKTFTVEGKEKGLITEYSGERAVLHALYVLKGKLESKPFENIDMTDLEIDLLFVRTLYFIHAFEIIIEELNSNRTKEKDMLKERIKFYYNNILSYFLGYYLEYAEHKSQSKEFYKTRIEDYKERINSIKKDLGSK